MAKWTNVAGVMSLDTIDYYNDEDYVNNSNIDNIETVKTCLGMWENELYRCYYDPSYKHFFFTNPSDTERWYQDAYDAKSFYGSNAENVKIPHGSEGPLFYNVNNIGSVGCVNNILVSFFGNLRDFDDTDVVTKLIPYFKNSVRRLNKHKIDVRNLSVNIISDRKNYIVTNSFYEKKEDGYCYDKIKTSISDNKHFY